MKPRLSLTVTLLCIGSMSIPVVAQQLAPVPALPVGVDMERVRMLYGAAAYDEALAAMPGVNGEPVRTDLEQYRALCLLALGREAEAITTVERLVRANPLYIPPAADTSPRMQGMFATARSKLLPDLAKRAYTAAKAAYETRDRDAAHGAFKRTQELIDSLPAGERAALSDLRLLAGEFLELSAPGPSAPPGRSADLRDPAKVDRKPEAAAFVGPKVVLEQLPAWVPPDATARGTEYVGVLRVQIGMDGRVTSVSIVKGSHPVYDVAAATAAKNWLYKPATSGGQPVASSKEIQVKLVPRRPMDD